MDDRQEYLPQADAGYGRIANAYREMEQLPAFLTSVMKKYRAELQAEIQRNETCCSNKKAWLEQQKNEIRENLEEKKREAELAKGTLMEQLSELSQQASAAGAEYQNALDQLPKGRGGKALAIGNDLSKVIELIQVRRNEDEKSIQDSISRLRAQENSIYEEKVAAAQSDYEAQLASATDEYQSYILSQEADLKEQKQKLFEEAQQTIMQRDPSAHRQMYELLQTNIPAEMNFMPAEETPEAVEMGYLEMDLDSLDTDAASGASGDPVFEMIRDQYSFALQSQYGRTTLQFPYGRSFEDAGFGRFIMYDQYSRTEALHYLRALEMRLFMSIPCGKLRVTMVDPVDLGRNFSMFSRLGDDDERIISTMIWSDGDRIKEQLRLLMEQIKHVNQQCLRGKIKNIVEYNRIVGKNAEPLQALFIADFPNQFDQEACDMLEKVISTGPECGVYTFIAASNEAMMASDVNCSKIAESMQYLAFDGDRLSQAGPEGFTNSIIPIRMPGQIEQEDIFEALINGIKTSDRITIYFDEVTDQLTQHPEKWFHFSDLNGIDVPVGLEGASRTVQIHLGGDRNTQHHALISGTTGSGKSTLLHTIIMSLLLRYSPEDVQIYLLDFKRGVEFKVYADSKLPNFRVISLDTEPEFGEAVLEELDRVQSERAGEFHDHNSEDIEGYNELAEADPEDDIYKISRIVLIIDEFHELFADPESETAKKCKKLLDQIVRQGRAMGVHVILASQTLPNDLSDVYGLISNRVALQSTRASAEMILEPDNEAVNALTNVDPGKGIFNSNGGDKDSNHPFRVAYFDPEEQRKLLDRIRERQMELYGNSFADMKPRLLLSSIQDDIDNPLNRFVTTGQLPRRLELGCPLYVGEEIAMEDEFGIRLKARRTQNLLILGSDPKRAQQICSFSAMSILFDSFVRSGEQALPEDTVITYFDFTKHNSGRAGRVRKDMDMMSELIARFPDVIRVFGADSLLDGLQILEEEQAAADHSKKHYVIFAGLNRAKRLLDNDGIYEQPPLEQFKKLLRQGPEAGFNYIIWANEPDSFLEYYGDILPEFNYRLVYDLTEEEYRKVIRSTSMDTDRGSSNVISYSMDTDNKKVRVYSKPLNTWFARFMDRLDGIDPDAEMADSDLMFDSGEFESDF